MTQLREIAVHVEEPRPGRFAWVLSEREREGGRWAELQRASAPVDSYRQAMADGLLALQALVDDLEQGPRKAQAPAGRSRPAAAPPAAPPRPRGFFGFGPAR